MSYEFYHATKIICEPGAISRTGEALTSMNFKNVLVVTDSFLAKSNMFSKLAKSLESHNITYTVFDDVKPNPIDSECVKVAELGKSLEVDAIIGLGGGSPMDQAKAAAALITNGGTCKDWDGLPLEKNMLPVICIPTTAGTGSEVTFVAVITDPDRKFKMSVFDPEKLRPTLAILDPELTLDLPSNITAFTGVDALTHAIEAYTCKLANPITDAIAINAIKLIMANIYEAVANGSNLEARSNMMTASMMGGMAFINSNVGAVHAISETVGAWYHTPHGIANSIFLPHVFKYNIVANPEKHAYIAKLLGVNIDGKTFEEAAMLGVDALLALNEKVKIPKLKDMDYMKKENFESIAETSAENLLSADNCRDIDKSGYMQVLNDAYSV